MSTKSVSAAQWREDEESDLRDHAIKVMDELLRERRIVIEIPPGLGAVVLMMATTTRIQTRATPRLLEWAEAVVDKLEAFDELQRDRIKRALNITVKPVEKPQESP